MFFQPSADQIPAEVHYSMTASNSSSWLTVEEPDVVTSDCAVVTMKQIKLFNHSDMNGSWMILCIPNGDLPSLAMETKTFCHRICVQ